ncbi:MAG: hypothetical protein JSS99_05695 [Actinobacteria bacterium]|nr:hypothetical protein [Actinomycetota bacterium]
MQVIGNFAAPRVRRHALLAGAAAAAAALGTGAMTAPSAHAAFTLGACEGTTFAAQGSSFQRSMQASMKTLFEASFGCNGSPAGPTYAANGSGNGNASMGAGGGNASLNCAPGCTNNPAPAGQRDMTTRLAGTDEPPNPTQQSNIDTAGTASTSDDGKIHVIPVAAGASVLIVHAPEGCDLSTASNLTSGTSGTVGGADTGDRASDHTQRLRFTSAMVEKIFAADSDADTWGEIAPGISGTGSGIASGDQTNNGVACGSIPVRRIVRFDNSGTTYSWKAYLALIDPGRDWLGTYNPTPNTVWPRAGGSGTQTPQAAVGAACNNADHLCSNTSSGAGPLTTAVAQTDGSVGYSDLATARLGGFDTTPSASVQDYTFWAPLQNNPGGVATGYAEPTFAAAAHTTTTPTKGANCQNVSVANVPDPARSPNGDPTQGDWSRAYAAGGASYPACVLTYALAWDDDAPVYGNTADEEAKARSVKDYLQKILVSSVGQGALFGADYSALPPTLLGYAQSAVDAIGWDKAAGGGGGTGGGGGGTGGGGGGGTGGGGGGGGTPPSNQFSLPSSSTSARQLLFTVQLPGAGTLKVTATAKSRHKTIRVASVSATVAAGGKVRVKLTLSAAAKRALAKAKSHKLTIKVKFTYTPTGGTARTVTRTVTVKAPKRHKRGGRH